MELKQHLEIGYVSKAHGLRGEVCLKTFDPSSDALWEVDRLLLRGPDGGDREVGLLDVKAAAHHFLAKLDGVRDRAEAESIVGSTVLVFREDLPPPEAGQFFLGDFIGLQALNSEGTVWGAVADVQSFGPVPNLVIHSPEGKEWLVPFAEPFVGNVDLERGVISVSPLEFEEP